MKVDFAVSRKNRVGAARAAIILAALAMSSAGAMAQTCSGGLTLSNTSVTSGVPTYQSAGDITASSGVYINTDGQGNPVGTASVTFVAVGKICLEPGFQAAATSGGGGFQAGIGQLSQTIVFGPLSSATLGSAVTLAASASSGLAVTYASNTTSVCTVSGATVTLAAAGTCSITASQPGNASYTAAAPVTQTFSVFNAQTITFLPLSTLAYGILPFGITATASSGLPVIAVSTTPGVCTLSVFTVTIVGTGTCSITASQAGNSSYAAANSVTQNFAVTAACPDGTGGGGGENRPARGLLSMAVPSATATRSASQQPAATAFRAQSVTGSPVTSAPVSASAGAPVYVLYRLFFRHVAALQAAASALDSAGKAGGSELRSAIQKSLFLSDAQAALLTQNAASCNAAIDQQHTDALPTIAAARASLTSLPAGAVPALTPTMAATVAGLEQARTDISNGCIASLHAALGDQMFSNIDVFVRTKFAQKVSTVAPVGKAPTTGAAVSRAPSVPATGGVK